MKIILSKVIAKLLLIDDEHSLDCMFCMHKNRQDATINSERRNSKLEEKPTKLKLICR